MSGRRISPGGVGPPIVEFARCETTGKVRFGSRGAATKTRSARRNKGHRMRTYLCPDCHGWHLTTQGASSDEFRKPKT